MRRAASQLAASTISLAETGPRTSAAVMENSPVGMAGLREGSWIVLGVWQRGAQSENSGTGTTRIAGHDEKKIMCTVDLGLSPANQSFEMIVDTGSSVSLLPAHVYETYFSHIPLKPTKVPLVTYSRQRIPVLGKLHLRAFHDGNTASATLFIVKSGSILLGLDLFEALEMVIMRNRVVLKSEQTMPATSCPELRQLRSYMTDGWPASSKGLPANMLPYYQSYTSRHYRDISVPAHVWKKNANQTLNPATAYGYSGSGTERQSGKETVHMKTYSDAKRMPRFPKYIREAWCVEKPAACQKGKAKVQ
ncbi:hypothetical protein F7725_002800 [Dissostichus mawsoni]|uniref:Peptidase A2 domain-containing protein n=1 Tax=Dissostichus mawsoni TaxID=36200 RepID=A0A7J5Y8C6_DISMA|nr:hypothetical protein F7725_002800 [Dissostichus mawsoni]